MINNPTRESKAVGKLALHVYTFAKAGDTLPMHTHTIEDKHITIVNRGSIKAYGPGNEPVWIKLMKPGDMAAFKANDPHAFVALEDDTKITNIVY
jgi:quercetin dioxygenase-like cupin family protein